MKVLILAVSFFFFTGLYANDIDSCISYTLRDSLVNFAQKHIGSPYKYGGANPGHGFDCSGFVMYVFRKFGILLPHSSQSIAQLGSEKRVEEAELGDIILFKGRNTNSIGHVGIVYNTPDDELIFIHSSSPRSGGVIFSSLDDTYYQKRFVKIVDVLS